MVLAQKLNVAGILSKAGLTLNGKATSHLHADCRAGEGSLY